MAKYLGEILIDYEVIDKEQLEMALEIQNSKGEFIGDILIDLCYIDEGTLVKYLKKQGISIDYKKKKKFSNIV